MQKKTLIAKLPLDVSLLNDAQIEACKAHMMQSFECSGLKVEFEMKTEDVEEATFLASLMAQIAAMPIGEITGPAKQPPMEVMELDESQSNVLRGFFGTLPNSDSAD